jgi:tetratricopeptide (TPR) repeat protein
MPTPACLCLFLLLATSAPAQLAPVAAATTESDAPSLSHAKQLVAKGQLDAALAELATVAAKQPEAAGVERLRGFVYYQKQDFLNADTAYAAALTHDPADLESMQMRGVVLYAMGRPADAVPLLEKAHTGVATANVDPNYVLGMSYMDTRRYDDARKAFAVQYDFAPDSPQAYLLAGRMFLRREYLPTAEESARKAIQLNPSLPLAHLLLGEIALAKTDVPGAITEFEKERVLNPLYAGIYDRLGDAYIRTGQLEKAQLSLDRAILLDPNSTGPYIQLGKVLLKQDSPLMAAMYLEHALRMDPGNYITHTLLGQAYRATGRREDATREYQTAEKIQANSTPKLQGVH